MRKRIQFRINIQFIAALLKLINVSWRLGRRQRTALQPPLLSHCVTRDKGQGREQDSVAVMQKGAVRERIDSRRPESPFD